MPVPGPIKIKGLLTSSGVTNPVRGRKNIFMGRGEEGEREREERGSERGAGGKVGGKGEEVKEGKREASQEVHNPCLYCFFPSPSFFPPSPPTTYFTSEKQKRTSFG